VTTYSILYLSFMQHRFFLSYKKELGQHFTLF
jgi:hypothetical protein